MAKIAGNYKLVKNDNFDVYLKHMGASEEIIKKVTHPNATLEINVDGNKYHFKSSSNMNLTFTLNEEYDEPLGEYTIKSLPKLDGNKITITSSRGDRSGTRTYEFLDTEMIMTLEADGVTAKRYYSRV